MPTWAQAAIDAANTGDTVVIPSGTFSFLGKVNAPDGIHIQGAGRDSTYLVKADDTSGAMIYVDAWTGQPNLGSYVPHVVVIQGSAKHGFTCNTITEHYLGVLIADAPDEIPPAGTAEITLRLMYWPEETYEQLIPGATFTLREGPKIVGYGRVLAANP